MASLLPLAEASTLAFGIAPSSGNRKQGPSPARTQTRALQLLFGAGGIYASYVYYGLLQEDVFRYESDDGTRFNMVWFLQVLESGANVAFGTLALVVAGLAGIGHNAGDEDATADGGRKWWGGTPNLSKKLFLASGFSQVCSKGLNCLALANGLSYPVATLAKCGKMGPVMIGSLILGGAKYSFQDYLRVLAIISGTAILSMSEKKATPSNSSTLGVVFILLSLGMDGITGGFQKRLLADAKRTGVVPGPFDLMTFTNLFMAVFAVAVSIFLGDFWRGLGYCARNPEMLGLLCKFSACSAVGQSFIFYTVAVFDPLVCSTVTTTRKVFSVLLSILLNGHDISSQGWIGMLLTISGILSEVVNRVEREHKKLKRKTSM